MVERKYHTPEQVAEMLQVTRHAVYRWVKEGKLEAVRVERAIRIPDEALNRFIKPAKSTEEEMAGKRAA